MTQLNKPILIDDLSKSEASEVNFIGFDFETLTPAGRPPEPIELGALMLRADLCRVLDFKFHEYIRPPNDVHFTSFDTAQTGIRPEHVANARPTAEVLSLFDKRVGASNVVFVAQNAKYDHGIFQRFEKIMPNSINRPYLDTVRIAKHLFPKSKSFKLDNIAHLTGVIIPPGRHSALVDVQVTLDVFAQLVRLCVEQNILYLSQLIKIGGITDFGKPKQTSLF